MTRGGRLTAAGDYGGRGHRDPVGVHRTLVGAASMKSFIDLFLAIDIVFLITLPVVIIMRKANRTTSRPVSITDGQRTGHARRLNSPLRPAG
jgi:hypothetical protein